MLDSFSIHPTLPASDFDRAKAWYRDTLGFEPYEDTPGGARYRTGTGAEFTVYPSSFAGTAQNTAAEFRVDDIDAAVDALTAKGVVFEQYDFPGLKTNEKGIADMNGVRGSWFKDSEGNIIAVAQQV